MTPEEYAGRRGGNVLECSLHTYRYATEVYNTYVQRLCEILRDPELLQKYQRDYSDGETEPIEPASDEIAFSISQSRESNWRRRRAPVSRGS